jgi:hypothetical protein
MPGGFQSSREITHYAEVFRLADQARLLSAPIWRRRGCGRYWRCTASTGSKAAMKRRPDNHRCGRPCGGVEVDGVARASGQPLVREETAKTVRQAMRDIGYVYNRAAAMLRGTSVGLIGLVINDLRNPFFAEFAVSFQMAMAARGYATVVSNADEDDGLQEKLVASMIEHGVDAVVISPAYGDPPRSSIRWRRPASRHAGPAPDGCADRSVPFLQFRLRGRQCRGDAAPDRDRGARIAFVGGLDERSHHAGTDGRVSRGAGRRKACRRCGWPDRRRGPSGGASRPGCGAITPIATPCSVSTIWWRWG